MAGPAVLLAAVAGLALILWGQRQVQAAARRRRARGLGRLFG